MRSLLSPRRAALVTALVLGSATLACGGDGNGTDPDPVDRVGNVTVSPSSAEIEIGETQQFTAVVTNQDGEPMNEPVSWSSSNTAAATVNQSSGLATGVGDGQTTITATADGVSDQATLTVVDPNPPEAPSDVVAMAVADDAIEVGWTDNSDNETGFLIEREEVTSGASGSMAGVFAEVGQVGANVTTFRDEGLDPSTSYRYRVLACNDNGCTGGEDGDGTTTDDVTTHEELVMDTQSLPDGTVNVAYSITLNASGGDGSFAWTVQSGDLPDGLSLSEAGVLDGTPSAEGTFTFTIRVTSVEQTVDREFTVEISAQVVAPEVTTDALPDGVEGEAYQATLSASRGDGSYAWAVVDGDLPDGLDLSADGEITGTPTTPGSSTFTVEVTSAGMTGEKELSITVNAALEIDTSTLPSGVVQVAYASAVTATGADGDYTFGLESGDLPDGLDLDSDGQVTGTPTTAGSSTFTVEVESGDGQTATKELTIEIFEPLEVTTTSLADGETGTAYNETLGAEGGDGDYTWAVTEGDLPAGIMLGTDTGELTGTPTADGTFDFTVEVTSGDGQTATAELSITVASGAPVVTTTSLPDGEVGTAYNQTLQASGGDGSYTWALISGDVPDGLTLATDGTISGTPTAAGTFDFQVQVTSAGQTDSQDLTIVVTQTAAAVTIETTLMAPSVANRSYERTLEATGGDGANYTWSVESGDFPPGLSLDAGTGTITGPPTTAGTYTFTVKVESGGAEDTQELTLEIVASQSGFQFTLFFVTDVPADVQAEVEDAAARWSAIITADVTDVTTPVGGLSPAFCDGFGQLWNGTSHDDIGVAMNIISIDGQGGTLASAGHCGFLRPANNIPYTGYMRLDLDDLQGFLDGTQAGRDQLEDVIFHEMGHVLGIGTRWDNSNGNVTGPAGVVLSGRGTTDPEYTGSGANTEYQNLGGSGNIDVENDGGSGTADSHWEESATGGNDTGLSRQAFDDEIMTGFVEPKGTNNPVSAITIAAVADLGYSVDLGAAEAYSLPTAPNEGDAGIVAEEEEGQIAYGDDIYRSPALFLLPDGRIRMITLDGRVRLLPRPRGSR